jgi:hypothetical protein
MGWESQRLAALAVSNSRVPQALSPLVRWDRRASDLVGGRRRQDNGRGGTWDPSSRLTSPQSVHLLKRHTA